MMMTLGEKVEMRKTYHVCTKSEEMYNLTLKDAGVKMCHVCVCSRRRCFLARVKTAMAIRSSGYYSDQPVGFAHSPFNANIYAGVDRARDKVLVVEITRETNQHPTKVSRIRLGTSVITKTGA
jgi:hypothetical protein